MTYATPFETERLILRPFGPQDLEPAMAFYVTERGRWHGAGPEMGPGRAWRIVAILTGHWHIHGWGSYALVSKETGATLGGVGPFFPASHPEREIGWSMFTEEGKGYASEAARAIIDRYLGAFGWPTLVSYIDPANARSIALAERLGAVRDEVAARPHDDDLVYRHRLRGGQP